jgi:hypothetical protein
MNITTTYLFNLVTNNDYTKLSEIIDSGKGNDKLYTFKARESLISKSILVRAKKCFDLLIDLVPGEEYKNCVETCYLKGMYNSLEYYVAAPNMDNMYYLTKLLEKNITINYYCLYKAINNIDLFIQLFNKFNKNNIDEIIKICYAAIMTKCNDIFMFIYNYIEVNNNAYINNQFKNKMYEQAIASHDTTTIEFLITKGLDWKVVNGMPSIYVAMKYVNLPIFNYIYSKYNGLSSMELNSIPNIKTSLPIRFSYNIKTMKCFNKVLLLPIDMNDMAVEIAKLFRELYSDSISTSHYQFNRIINKFKQNYIVIEALFNANKIKSNPLLLVDYNNFTILYKNNKLTLAGYPDHITMYKDTVMRFVDICKANKYELESFVV